MMGQRVYLGLVIALCILGAALAARPNTSSISSYKVQRRRVAASTSDVSSKLSGESQQQQHSDQHKREAHSAVATESPKSETVRLLKVAQAIARSHSTSEVLTLNLTNLLILIVLKAIIFGIGLFYFGGVTFKGSGGHGWSSRSLEKKSSFMTEGELLLMLTYLLGSTDGNYECMYRVACEDPSKAKEYLKVSKMVLKGAKFMKKYVSYNPRYEDIVTGLQNAVEHKRSGGECSKKYICSDVPGL